MQTKALNPLGHPKPLYKLSLAFFFKGASIISRESIRDSLLFFEEPRTLDLERGRKKLLEKKYYGSQRNSNLEH